MAAADGPEQMKAPWTSTEIGTWAGVIDAWAKAEAFAWTRRGPEFELQRTQHSLPLCHFENPDYWAARTHSRPIRSRLHVSKGA